MKKRLGLLGLRDLRYVVTAALVSSLGDGMVTVALAFAILDLTHSATDLGLVLAARTLTTVLVMLVGGVVADRVSRRRVMILADLVRCAGQLAIGLALVLGSATLAEIVISQVLVAGANAFFEPAAMGLIQATAGEYKQEANALKVMATSGTGLLGPALGGLLVATVGGAWALVADGVTYAVSALLLARVPPTLIPADASDAEAGSFLADLRGGLHEVVSRRWVWATILTMSLANMLMSAWPVLAPVICRRHLGGAPAYAALSVAFVAGMLLGGSALLRIKPRFPLRAGFLFCIPGVLPMILLGVGAPLVLVILTQILSGVGATVLNALWWTALQEKVPAQAISRVSSYDWAGSLAVQPIGLLLVGPLAGAVGAQTALALCGVAATVITAAGLAVRDIRGLEVVREPAPLTPATA